MPTWWTLLALLLVLALGAAAAGYRARVRATLADATFRCKLRRHGRRWAAPPAWPVRRTRARWTGDVLVVRRGVLRGREVALPARALDRAVRRTTRLELRGLGDDPVVLTLRLDSGDAVDVAARGSDLTALVGPFLAASIPELPRAPKEPQWRGR